MSTLKVPAIFYAIDKISGPLQKMEGRVSTFAARSERQFRRLAPTISSVTSNLLAFGSAASIAGGIYFTIDAVKEYDSALASLSAITGITGDAFIPFKAQVSAVAKETNKSAVDVAKAFEIVGSMKSELLGNAEALALVTKASITLSKASRDDLATAAGNLTGIMNQFELGADQAERAMNVLAAGSVVGAANISQVNESMANFGAVAKSANISLEKSVALVEVMGQKSIFGAEAGTKLRGSILKLQQAGVGYASGQFDINDALTEAKKKIDSLKTAREKDAAILKMFGAENITTGKILLDNIALFDQYSKGVTGTNTATEQAAINTNTLSGKLEAAKAKWINMVTGSDAANGSLDLVKKTLTFVTDHMETLVTTISALVFIMAAWWLMNKLIRGSLIAFNVIQGITVALTGGSALAFSKGTIAYKAYRAAVIAMTAVQWLWNTAIAIGLGPITLIIIAIAAIIALVVVAIKKWDSWGAALAFFMGPLGWIISLIQSFRRNWDMIVQAFKTEGILAGLKAIGKTLLDAILMPLQQMLELAAKIPGKVGQWAREGAGKIQQFRQDMGVTLLNNPGSAESGKDAINTKATQQQQTEKTITESKKEVSIDFKNMPDWMMPKVDGAPLSLSPAMSQNFKL